MNTVVVMENYTKMLRGHRVLDEINLDIERGQILGVTGRNGSGKTMLLRAMCGLIRPDKGKITVMEKELNRRKPFPDSVGVVLENIRFWKNMSGFQTLQTLAAIQNKIGETEIRETLERVGLDPLDRRTVAKYSLGMKQKLAIAQAVMEKPALILLDEPTNALDQESVENFRRLIKEEQARGATIILASHMKEDMEALCDRVIHMEEGKIIG
ncbi:MAG: ABC transporter ATP-binding protein [Lachnospiraceae bacterium]|nr:ABC transporter ATP-binding protein [Lachnospiraceae bacterium]